MMPERATWVTWQPMPAKACASSQPIGPPPSTTRRSGFSVSDQMVSEVTWRTESMPGMFGMTGVAPVAMTMARVLRVCLVAKPPASVSTSTVHGEVMRARPWMTSTPNLV